MLLEKYGLDNFFVNQLGTNFSLIGKVLFCSKSSYKIIAEDGLERFTTLKSSTYYKTNMLPKVGDFVIFEEPITNSYVITSILERKNVLKRKLIGKHNKEQIIVANVDYAFITLPLDEQYNIKKTERIISACVDSNIEPVIVITKLDLSKNLLKDKQQVSTHFPAIKVIVTSMKLKDTITPIINLLKNNKTGVFIGSSGTGKSSLTNLILGYQKQKTSYVSKEKSKGRHTTTSKELFLLETGGCVIDTPGIREFALWLDNEDTLLYTFADIKDLAKKCKFSNCTHTIEPSCAVLQALKHGELSKERYINYIKLQQEEIEKHSVTNKKTKQQKQLDKKGKEKVLAKTIKSSKKYNPPLVD